MSALANAILGIAFLIVGSAATFLMYHLWGYPFDHEKRKSAAPPRLMRLHRALGWIYIIIYIVLMTQMVPRLWRYQVEFPARSVAHLLLGMTIGMLLIVKVSIVRFFKHLEGTLVPLLGTALLICTVLLLGLSVPFALRTVYLERIAPGGSAFSAENLARVNMLLPVARLPQEAPLSELASPRGLKRGQAVLLTSCVQCHDLRTILIKPRTPEDWVSTIKRMGERATSLEPVGAEDQWFVSAYLIAISPDLQKAVLKKRELETASGEARQAMASELLKPSGKTFDLAESKRVYEATCIKCHALSYVEENSPTTDKAVAELVGRMIDNGLRAPQNDLQQIMYYLNSTYATK